MATVDPAAITVPGRRRRDGRWPVVGRVALYGAMIIASAALLLPFYWLVISSLKTNNEVFTAPLKWWPDTVVWENYLAGLREAGWQGDARAVRFCYTAYPALRWGLVFPLVMLLPYAHDAERRAEAEAKYEQPIEQLLSRWASAFYFLLDWADEARCLADTL